MQGMGPDFSMLIAGYSWRMKSHLLKVLSFDWTLRKMNATNTSTIKGIPFAVIGDNVKGVRHRIFQYLEEKQIDANSINMEPLDVLLECINNTSSDYRSIGGNPQMVKVYPYPNVLPFGFLHRQRDLKGNINGDTFISYYGRPLLPFETFPFPIYDLEKGEILYMYQRSESEDFKRYHEDVKPLRGFDRMNNEKKELKTFDLSFGIGTLFTIILIGVICFFPLWFSTKSSGIDFTDTGQIGDTIGGIMGPFVAIIAALLTFMAFWVQFKANQQQRYDIALERFESNLFQLISLQEEITNNLIYTPRDGADPKYGTEIRGRSIFREIYESRLWTSGMSLSDEIREKGFAVMSKDKDISMFDHYFRHLYRIFKYIDEAVIIGEDKTMKYEYTAIVRSMLSEYELIFLYYNSMNINGHVKFKQLIEKYAILNNLRTDKLATLVEQVYYPNLLKGNALPESANPSEYYSKSAFVFESDSK